MKKWILVLLAPAILFAADLTDNDGDGLPDLWEAAFGLSTNSLNGASGINGTWGDPDDDGLDNMGEYLAGYTVVGGNIYSNYTWAVAGLNPTNANSLLAGLPDGFCRVSTNRVPLNWMFGDHDMVDSIWESISLNEASAFLPEISSGNKTWPEFDRCRMTLAKHSPTVRLYLSSTDRNVDDISVCVYSDLHKKYDAKWVVKGCNKTHILGTPNFGELKHNSCFWLAYSGSDNWNAGSPVGYGYTSSNNWDETSVGIDLKKYSGHYFLYSIPSPTFSSGKQKKETHVQVRRSLVDGVGDYTTMLIDKIVDSDGTFVSGLDAFSRGWLGLDWGLEGVPTAYSRTLSVYEVWVGHEIAYTYNSMVLAFTNRFDAGQARPTIAYPYGGSSLKFSRPKIRFSMPDDYQAFSVEIKAGNSSGGSILSSAPIYVPTKTLNGEYEWCAPISVGDRVESGLIFSNNNTYVFRVAAFNTKFVPAVVGEFSLYSAWRTFSTRVDTVNGDSGTIAVSLRYPGAATTLVNRVVVEARTCRGTTQYPDCRYTLNTAQIVALTNLTIGATNVLLSGLAHGTYYVSAFIDSNTNRVRDCWESWGYNNMRGVAGYAAYDFKPVDVSGSFVPNRASIIVEDSDTDADWYPDVWEYEKTGGTNNWLGAFGPSPSTVNPLLQ